MKLCISKIHLGRYRLEMLDDNNQVLNGTDGGSALVMMWLHDWIFQPEHEQYQRDQRSSSDAIGAAVIADLISSAPPGAAEALAELDRKRQARFNKLLRDFSNNPKVKPNR